MIVGEERAPAPRKYKEPPSRGRPKGARNRKTIVRAVVNEMHSVVENGKRRRRSALDLVLLRLRNLALQGKDIRAFNEFDRLITVYQPQEVDENVGYLLVPAPITPEEAIAEGERANTVARARRAAREGDGPS